MACPPPFHTCPARRPCQGSASYASPSTGAHHSVEQPSPGASSATWENQLSLAAPCQCFTPAGINTTPPGFSARASRPHS